MFEFKRSREFVKIFGQAPVLEPGLAENSVLRVEFKRSREFIEVVDLDERSGARVLGLEPRLVECSAPRFEFEQIRESVEIFD